MRGLRHPQAEVRHIIAKQSVGDAIRADLAAGDTGYRAAGEKFIAQKAKLLHGEWLPWLKLEGFSQQVAHRYMAYHSSGSDLTYAEWRDQREPSRRKTVSFEASEPFDSSQENDGLVGAVRMFAVALGSVSAKTAASQIQQEDLNPELLGLLDAIQRWLAEFRATISPHIVACSAPITRSEDSDHEN